MYIALFNNNNNNNNNNTFYLYSAFHGTQRHTQAKYRHPVR